MLLVSGLADSSPLPRVIHHWTKLEISDTDEADCHGRLAPSTTEPGRTYALLGWTTNSTDQGGVCSCCRNRGEMFDPGASSNGRAFNLSAWQSLARSPGGACFAVALVRKGVVPETTRSPQDRGPERHPQRIRRPRDIPSRRLRRVRTPQDVPVSSLALSAGFEHRVSTVLSMGFGPLSYDISLSPIGDFVAGIRAPMLLYSVLSATLGEVMTRSVPNHGLAPIGFTLNVRRHRHRKRRMTEAVVIPTLEQDEPRSRRRARGPCLTR